MNCIFESALPNSKPWIFGFAHTSEGEGRILVLCLCSRLLYAFSWKGAFYA